MALMLLLVLASVLNKVPSTFQEIIFNIMFIPSIKWFLNVEDCTFTDNYTSTLDVSPETKCWKGAHLWVSIAAASLMPIYLFFALKFVVSTKADGVGKLVQYNWRYSLLTTMVFVIGAVIDTNFGSTEKYAGPIVVATGVLNLILLLSSVLMTPSASGMVNHVLVSCWSLTLWCSICNGVALSMDESDKSGELCAPLPTSAIGLRCLCVSQYPRLND